MSHYLVTAIVSTFRSERFIEGRIQDLLRQTLGRRLEIIVIDSNSPEGEGRILEPYLKNNPNLRYIRTPERESIYKSWNRGIQLARGRYITNANTDDRLKADALEMMAVTLEKNPDCALVYGDSLVSRVANAPFEQVPDINHFKWPSFDRKLLFQVCYVGPHPMWRKSLHEKYGFFDERFQSAGDYEFWLRIVNEEKFLHVPRFVGAYYLNEGGVEKSNQDVSWKEAEIAREMHWPHNWGKRPAPSGNYLHLHDTEEKGSSVPLISVVVPTKNRPEPLLQALKSIQQQTCQDFEVLLINDGGVDVSRIVKAMFPTMRISFLNSTGSGVSTARNTGLKAARGKYIAYLDDDDIYLPEHLETLVTSLESSEYKVAYSDAVQAFYVQRGKGVVCAKKELEHSKEFSYQELMVANYIPTLCMMHERSCLKSVGYFDEGLQTHEDWEFWLRLGRLYPFRHVKKVTAEYNKYINSDVFKNTTFANRPDFLRTMGEVYRRCKPFSSREVREKQKKRMLWLVCVLNKKLQGVVRINDDFVPELRKALHKGAA